LIFDEESGYQNALKDKGSVVLGDIPNFSDKGPILLGGSTVVSTIGH
jgi:hypothetical protein